MTDRLKELINDPEIAEELIKICDEISERFERACDEVSEICCKFNTFLDTLIIWVPVGVCLSMLI